MTQSSDTRARSDYALPILTGGVVLFGLYLSSLYNYLLFHTLVESFSIIVGFVIFVLAWNTRPVQENHYLLILGLASLFTGILEMAHTLAYKGLGVFPAQDANLATQLWLAFRYLFSLTFLIAPIFITRVLSVEKTVAVYAVVTSLLLWTIFTGIFPDCFVEGGGLTPFKIVSEYVIIVIFFAALVLLLRKRTALDRDVLRPMVLAILSSIASELFFTRYAGVFDFSNLVGHFFLLLSVYFIYRAIVVTSIVKPSSLLFRNLKVSEEALKASELKYRSLFENMIDGFALHQIVVDAAGKPVDCVFLEVNDAFETLTGFKRNNIINKKATEVMPGIERDPADWIGTFGRVALTGTTVRFEQYAEPLGRWYSVLSYSPMKNQFATVFEDITDRRKAEVELRKAKDELELMVQARTAELKIANEELSEEFTGRGETEKHIRVTNELLKLYIQKLSRKEYLEEAVKLLGTWSGCRHVGIRIIDKKGNIPYLSCLGFSDEFLKSENMLSLDRDGCACTRVVLQQPEPQDLPTMTPAGSFYTNNMRKFMEDLTDEQRGRFRGVCSRSGFLSVAVVPIKYQERILGAIHLADEGEGLVPHKSVEFLEQTALIFGEAIYRFGIEEERMRLASALESTAEGVVITEPSSGLIQYVNLAFEQITGYTKDELLGHKLHLLDSGKQGIQFYQELREMILRDGVWRGRMVSKKKDGTLYYEDCTVSPVKGPSGEILNYVSLKRDITEKLRLESIAESVNTMDSIGYIFSGVRHEIGNPINSVNMILGILSSKLPNLSQDAIRDYLDRIVGQISRVEFLLRSLKSFNMYETQEPHYLGVASFMEQFLPLVKDDLETKGIMFDIKLDPQADRLHADPRALQQVLLNLITNAIDAVRERERPMIALSVSKSDGIVRIEVEDNGCGIPEDKVKDLFKPFYTTKATGTGLGLVIVKKMITRMNGTIDIESRRDVGTVVTISLPEGTHEEQ